jgi:hypothetical protein
MPAICRGGHVDALSGSGFPHRSCWLQESAEEHHSPTTSHSEVELSETSWSVVAFSENVSSELRSGPKHWLGAHGFSEASNSRCPYRPPSAGAEGSLVLFGGRQPLLSPGKAAQNTGNWNECDVLVAASRVPGKLLRTCKSENMHYIFQTNS